MVMTASVPRGMQQQFQQSQSPGSPQQKAHREYAHHAHAHAGGGGGGGGGAPQVSPLTAAAQNAAHAAAAQQLVDRGIKPLGFMSASAASSSSEVYSVYLLY
jgi:hypothetical protein